jgi:hypothetical protein
VQLQEQDHFLGEPVPNTFRARAAIGWQQHLQRADEDRCRIEKVSPLDPVVAAISATVDVQRGAVVYQRPIDAAVVLRALANGLGPVLRGTTSQVGKRMGI